MRVITIANVKGGVGKSTIAFNLAVEFSKQNNSILLIDTDPQQTAAKCHYIRSENSDLQQFGCSSFLQPIIHREIKRYDNFDIVVIDTGGRDSKVFRSAMSASNEVYIPLGPSQVDIESTILTIEYLDEIRSIKEDIECFLLLNRAVSGTKATKEVGDVIAQLKENNDISSLETVIHNRTAFARSMEEGKGVTEYEPKGKAAWEIRAMYSEIKK